MQLQLHKYMEISSMFDGVATIPGVFLCLGGSIILFSTLACCCTAKGKVPLLYMVWYSHSTIFKIFYNLISHISYIYIKIIIAYWSNHGNLKSIFKMPEVTYTLSFHSFLASQNETSKTFLAFWIYTVLNISWIWSLLKCLYATQLFAPCITFLCYTRNI